MTTRTRRIAAVLRHRTVTHAAVFGAGVLAAVLVTAALGTASESDHHHAQFSVSRMHGSSVTDVSDDRRLAGFAHDVFVGRVIAQRGRVAPDAGPETQWTVEVLKVYKTTAGLTEGAKTVVNQQGGYHAESNTLVLFDGDSLLETDGTYLFATRTNSERGWRTLVPRYGDLPLAEVATTGQVSDVDARWQRAVRTQIPFRPGG
jgi:hypothetical protein